MGMFLRLSDADGYYPVGVEGLIEMMSPVVVCLCFSCYFASV
jgi:hypothetical protein